MSQHYWTDVAQVSNKSWLLLTVTEFRTKWLPADIRHIHSSTEIVQQVKFNPQIEHVRPIYLQLVGNLVHYSLWVQKSYYAPHGWKRQYYNFKWWAKSLFHCEISGSNPVTLWTEWMVLPTNFLEDHRQYWNTLSCFEHWRNFVTKTVTYLLIQSSQLREQTVSLYPILIFKCMLIKKRIWIFCFILRDSSGQW